MRPWLASAGAVAAGFIVTAVASTAADAVMACCRHISELAPVHVRSAVRTGRSLSRLLHYRRRLRHRRLTPNRPMRHAWILAGIGLAAGLAGVVAYCAIGGAGTRS
jgi:hypothetical protein